MKSALHDATRVVAQEDVRRRAPGCEDAAIDGRREPTDSIRVRASHSDPIGNGVDALRDVRVIDIREAVDQPDHACESPRVEVDERLRRAVA